MKYNIYTDENKYINRIEENEEGEYELEDFNFDFMHCYKISKKKIIFDEKKYNDEITIIKNIDLLNEYHQKLNDTDFMVIKTMEYQLCGLDIPYDIKKLHKQRQDLRDKINELEK